MIYSISGLMNSGKSLYMTALLFRDYLQGRTIYTNLDLGFPHVKINRDFLIKLGNEQPILKDVSFGFDELWIWLDCRDSGDENKVSSYFFLQSSKDDTNIYLTAQNNTQNDKRIRENLHKVCMCTRGLILPNTTTPIFLDSEERFLFKNSPEMYEYLYIIASVYKRKIIGYYADLAFSHYDVIKASTYFKLYDTTQKVSKKVKNEQRKLF